METIHEAYMQMKAELAEASSTTPMNALNYINEDLNDLLA